MKSWKFLILDFSRNFAWGRREVDDDSVFPGTYRQSKSLSLVNNPSSIIFFPPIVLHIIMHNHVESSK